METQEKTPQGLMADELIDIGLKISSIGTLLDALSNPDKAVDVTELVGLGLILKGIAVDAFELEERLTNRFYEIINTLQGAE